MTIERLLNLKESENKVEFKAAKGGSYSYNGGSKVDPKERRKCILGYVVALANEGGGYLVFGVSDKHPHEVVGTAQSEGATGLLESNIYRDLRIRVHTLEVYQGQRRVLIIQVPSRPIGRLYKFEDVPLMRIGEELLTMSDQQYLKIIQEQEPDFSETFCEGLKIEDLDLQAIETLKVAYSRKQNNSIFLSQSNSRCLSDLNLVSSDRVTYAALILLGKQDIIQKYLPQSAIHLEYRNSGTQIPFDERYIFQTAYFLTIEKLWEKINLRNGKVPVQEGLYIFDIPLFNREVIREAVNNAVAHRDYRKSSEIVIKQNPQGLDIINPGGFPPGVSLQNLLTVNSTPRNRLLTDVLSKTGIVERSGQGVDKIFYQSLSEAKGAPDYSASDDFQVELKISAIVKDKAFALFIGELQKERKDKDKLSVQQIITLDAIREGKPKDQLDRDIIEKLHAEGLIEKVGKTSNQKLRLSKAYYLFTNKEVAYTNSTPIDESYIVMKINQHLKAFGKAKMGQFAGLFDQQLTREQVKNIVYKLTESGYLAYNGTGPAREYFFGPKSNKSSGIPITSHLLKSSIE